MISLEGPTNKSHRDSTHNFHVPLLTIGYQPNGESFGYGVSFFFSSHYEFNFFPNWILVLEQFFKDLQYKWMCNASDKE